MRTASFFGNVFIFQTLERRQAARCCSVKYRNEGNHHIQTGRAVLGKYRYKDCCSKDYGSGTMRLLAAPRYIRLYAADHVLLLRHCVASASATTCCPQSALNCNAVCLFNIDRSRSCSIIHIFYLLHVNQELPSTARYVM